MVRAESSSPTEKLCARIGGSRDAGDDAAEGKGKGKGNGKRRDEPDMACASSPLVCYPVLLLYQAGRVWSTRCRCCCCLATSQRRKPARVFRACVRVDALGGWTWSPRSVGPILYGPLITKPASAVVHQEGPRPACFAQSSHHYQFFFFFLSRIQRHQFVTKKKKKRFGWTKNKKHQGRNSRGLATGQPPPAARPPAGACSPSGPFAGDEHPPTR